MLTVARSKNHVGIWARWLFKIADFRVLGIIKIEKDHEKSRRGSLRWDVTNWVVESVRGKTEPWWRNRGEEAYGGMKQIARWNLGEQSQDFSRYVRLESVRSKVKLFQICSFGIYAKWEFSRYDQMESERGKLSSWNLSEVRLRKDDSKW